MQISILQLALLIVFSSISYAEEGFAQNVLNSSIQLEYKKAPLIVVLQEIERKSGVKFAYSQNFVQLNEPVSIEIEDKLSVVLNRLLLPINLEYKVIGSQIAIKRSNKTPLKLQGKSTGRSAESFPLSEIQSLKSMESLLFEIKDINVKGRVTSQEDGQPIPGVNVVVKGTTVGTTTNTNGEYALVVPEGESVLVYSFIGYTTEEVTVANRSLIDVSLESDVKQLSEVVVVGYGTQERKDVTGAISSISSKSIKDMPITSLDAAMAGQAPGVQVSQPTGIPGGGISVRVRGTGSVGAGNEPLYVVDGFPIEGSYNQTNNPLANLNPNDIESMEILKDASATAIYGSRGSNGVVIITTKNGKEGKSKINFDFYTGFQEVEKKIDLLNAQEYAEYIVDSRNNAWIASGANRSASDPNSARNNAIYQIPPGLENPSSLGKGTDWQDEIFRKGMIQNYQLSVSGGTSNLNYFVSGGYHKTNGVILNSDFERYSFRVNLESKLSDKVKVGVNLSPSYSFSNIIDSEGHFGNGAVVLSSLLMPPHLPVKLDDGKYSTGVIGFGLSGIQNPVQTALEETNQRGVFRILGTSFVEINLIDNLNFRATFGTDFENARRNAFNPSTTELSGIAKGTSGTSQNINWLTEYTLNYSKNIEKHSFDILAGYTVQKNNSESNYLAATTYPNDLVETLNAGVVSEGNSGRSQWSLLSYLGRINYRFNDKYLVTATVRRDGSSRFGSNNKWGIFPSASLGWRASEEDFLKVVTWLNDLKVRASYGVTGNNYIDNYEHLALATAQNYIFGPNGGTIANGLYTNRLANPDLTWETNTQLNVGLDVSLFNNRVSLTVDFYDKITSDLLLEVPVPSLTGYTKARENIGKIKNMGWEFSLSTRNFVQEFQWRTDFNITFNKNEVLALGPGNAPIFSDYDIASIFVTQLGSPLGNFYGYKAEGVYLNQADVDSNPHFADSKPGQLKFKDVSGDGNLTTADRTILGNPFPDFTYGFTNSFSFKGIDLNILIQGVEGAERLNLGRRFYGNYAGTANSLVEVKDRWHSPENPGDGETPIANRDLGKYTSSNASANVSSKFVEDASFIRIRNISLGYNLPQNVIKRLALQNIRVYASVQNVYTFTKYTGFNPEVSLVGHSTLTPGIDYGTYPLPRTYTIGLNFGI